MNLDTSVALVTGAARRVGRAIAVRLARGGCHVVVHYHRSQSDAEALQTQIRSISRQCHLVRGDLADAATWRNIVESAADAGGRLDILVNNASVFDTTRLRAFDADQWDRIFRVNVTAPAGLCHFAAPHLAGNGGKIVNVTDICADRPWSAYMAYCASKAALANLTKSLAKALAPKVQVNAVAPGIAIFPEHYDEATRESLINQVPLKRAGSPEEIADAVHFLCAHGDYITGQIIDVDGGRSIA